MKYKSFIHCEISKREFEAKLLLSAIASTKGIDVYLGNILGLKIKKIPRFSIFHHKDCAPSPLNLNLFKKLKKKNIFISCQDEEGGIEEKKVFFSKPPVGFFYYRYGNKSIKLVDAIFTWSNYDYINLIKRFKKYKNKIFRTGNPRADIWSKKLEKFYPNKGTRKYLLINSHTGGIVLNKTFKEILNITKNAFYIRDKKGFEIHKKHWFQEYSNRTKYFHRLSNTVIEISKRFPKEKILFRPHPQENSDQWKYMFKDRKNIEVSKYNSSTYWMYRAKVLIQNGCYTSIEAANLGLDIVTYIPKEIKMHVKSFTGGLGDKCQNEKQLFKSIKNILYKKNNIYYKKLKGKNFKLVNDRFDFPKNELNSEKIVKIWLNLLKQKKIQNNYIDEFMFKTYIFIKNLKHKVFNFNSSPKVFIEEDRKFEDINYNDVSEKIISLNKILNTDKKIKFKVINKQLLKIYTD